MNYYDILLAKKLEDDRDPQVVGLSVTENGTYAEEGKVYKPVVVNVPLGSKSITANGIYNATSDNLKGFSSVDVNVEGYKIADVENLPASIASFQNGESTLWNVDMTMTKEHNNNGSWSGDTFTGSHRTVFAFSGNTITVTHSVHEDSVRIMDSGNPELRLGAGNYTLSGWESALDDSYITLKVGNTNYNVDLSNDSYDFTLDSKKNVEMTLYIDANSSGTWTFAPKITHKNKGGVSLPMPNLKIAVEPVQSGSGDPSPENIRPISGWSAVDVNVSGVNVWDEEWEVGDIDAQGNPTSSTTLIRAKNFNPCKPNTTYKVVISSSASMYMKYYDKDKNFISPTVSAGSTITTPTNCYYFKFVMGSAYGTTYNNDISINYPSTDTEYHAYNGSTITIPFTDSQGNPIEVYGGECDVVNGGGNAYKKYDSYNGETLIGPWISDRDAYVPNTSPTIGAQVVDMGDTSTFYTQPTAIKTNEGTNNLSANTGDVVEASYWEEL